MEEQIMAEVVVLGARLEGTLAAFELVDRLRPKDGLTLIGQGGAEGKCYA
jgi:hypothetical protein